MDINNRLIQMGFLFLIIFLMIFSFPVRAEENEGEEKGEYVELTGTLNYILFGLTLIIFPWNYFYKNFSGKERYQEKLKDLNKWIKNLHYISGILFTLVITYHAFLVISKWNIYLEAGLLVIWFYMITGVLFFIDKIPGKAKKWIYKSHGNMIILVLGAILLYFGHIIGD